MKARLCSVGDVLMVEPQGPGVGAALTRASGHAEWLAAVAMLDRLPTMRPATLGADRGFDAREFVMELRERRVTSHIAQNASGRRWGIDGRTTRHEFTRSASGRRKGSRKLLAGSRRSPGRPHPTARSRTGALGVHVRGRGLQPDPAARVDRSDAMTPATFSRSLAGAHCSRHEPPPVSTSSTAVTVSCSPTPLQSANSPTLQRAARRSRPSAPFAPPTCSQLAPAGRAGKKLAFPPSPRTSSGPTPHFIPQQ